MLFLLKLRRKVIYRQRKFNDFRKQQPYEQYKLEYKLPGSERWESKLAMYESDPNFQNELDFEPGLEGFLHNIKRYVVTLSIISIFVFIIIYSCHPEF